MRIFGVVLVSLLFVPSAFGAYPGTHREVRLEPAASFVAGKTVSVYCADGVQAWQDLLAFYSLPPSVDGFAQQQDSAAYYGMTVCEPLLAWADVSASKLGRSLLTFTHEATHLTGLHDEAQTDCAALRKVRVVAWFYFGVRPPFLRHVFQAALTVHEHSPPQYRSVPCFISRSFD